MQLQVETTIYKDGAIGNDISDASTKATSYITNIDEGGISIHPAGDEDNKIRITSEGTEIYQGGNSVAQYGATARIGKEGNSRFLINSNSLEAYDDENKLYFSVSDEGLQYGNNITVASTDYANSVAGDAETNAKEYAKSYTDSAIEEYNPDLTNYVTKDSQILKDLQSQIDGAIDTWYFEGNPTLNNEPAVNWGTNEQKEAHLRDLYFNTLNGHTFRWAFENNEYKWILIEDTDATKALADAATAQDTADGKRRIFVNQPTDAEAYDIGDLWVNATYGNIYTNEVLRCQTSKSKGEAFNINHWIKASKYTDDSNLISYQEEVRTTYETIDNVNALEGRITQSVGKLAVKVAGMYAISNTASDIANKNATITPALSNDEVWELTKGTTITVKFTEANTTTSPTLNINNTGARSIRTYNGNSLSEEEYKWKAGDTFTFVYDETNWLMQDSTFAVQINNAQTSIIQTADSIESLASNSDTYIKPDGTEGTNTIKSTFTQQAGQIALRVEKSGVIAAINASVEEEGGSELKIKADKINIEGATIFTSGRLSEETLEETYVQKSEAVSDIVIQYASGQYSNDHSDINESDWRTGSPTWTEGRYVWQRVGKTINGVTGNWVYACIQGAQGEGGGEQGYSVEEVKILYYLKSNTTPPEKPNNTAYPRGVINDSTSEDAWTIAVPTYITGYYYFFCAQTKLSSNEYIWSDPALDNGMTNSNQQAVEAMSKAESASSKEQRIYYRTNARKTFVDSDYPTTWLVEDSTNVYNQWTTKIPPLTAAGQLDDNTVIKYLYLYTCIQRQTVGGDLSHTTALLDESTTVIDGGNIITSSIEANRLNVEYLSAIKANLGNITAGTLKDGEDGNNLIDLNNGTLVFKDQSTWNTSNYGIKYDSNGLDVKGAIYANTGYIGGVNGWTIESQKLYNGTIGANNSMYLSTKDMQGKIAGIEFLDENKTIPVPWRFTVGSNFGITADGIIYATGANISGTITITDSNLSNVYTVDEINANVSAIRDDVYGVVTYEYIVTSYNAIEEPSGNPKENGWYELNNNIYTLTEDTEINSGKTYYEKIDTTYVVYSENQGKTEDEEDNIVYYYMSYTTEGEGEQAVTTEHKVYLAKEQLVQEIIYNVVTAEDLVGNPQEQGWYELIGDNYTLTEDTEVFAGKEYYKQEEQPKKFIKGAIAERVNSLTTDTAALAATMEQQYNTLSNKEDLSLIAKGYASISNDILTLFKQDNEGKIVSALELTSVGIDLKAEGALVATMRNDNGIGIMRATNMEQTFVKMIQTDGTELFQWIAQSNGHLSLKKM